MSDSEVAIVETCILIGAVAGFVFGLVAVLLLKHFPPRKTASVQPTRCTKRKENMKPLLANPCDGNPRVGQNGSTIVCVVTPPVILDPAAVDPAPHATLNLVLTAANYDTLLFSVEIGYVSGSVAVRKTVLVRRPAPGLLKVATAIDIPVDAVLEFVQVEELTRTNAAGFVNE